MSSYGGRIQTKMTLSTVALEGNCFTEVGKSFLDAFTHDLTISFYLIFMVLSVFAFTIML